MTLSLTGCFYLPERAQVFESRSQSFSGIRQVVVQTKNGSVDVVADRAATDIDVGITKFARGYTEEEARRNAASIEVEVSRAAPDSDVLRVIVHVPDDLRSKSAGAHLDISLPARVDIEIGTSNGRVGVKGTEGDVDVRTSNGRVEISDVRGNVFTKTSNGAVVIKDVVGNAELRTSNGGIDIERVEADIITAITSNGKINAREVTGEPTLETSNGSIRLRVASLPESPQVKAKTRNGSIYVELPSTVNAELSLRTSNGRIDNKLEGASVTGYKQSKKRVNAILNGGGGNIDVVTSNGRITFRTSR